MTNKEQKRFKELEDKAEINFRSNFDYSPIDWLDTEEVEEYQKLWDKNWDRIIKKITNV